MKPALAAGTSVDGFLEDLAALTEPLQRERRIIEWLQTTDPDKAVMVIGGAVDAAFNKSSVGEIALLSFLGLRFWEEAIGYDRFAELYRCATTFGLEEVRALMREGPAQRQAPAVQEDSNERLAKTLGERKALATTRDRSVIDRLLCDRHPHVIRMVLANPRIVEADVVRLAAQQPQTLAVLNEITRSAKWLSRYRVKVALVNNPYTPSNLAMSLATLLSRSDLRELVNSSVVHPHVRARAEKLLQTMAS